MASKALKLAVALLTCVSVGLPPSLAEARPRWGHWGAGWHGGYGPGWGYGPRPYYASSFYGYPGYHGGYYPAYSGGYYPGIITEVPSITGDAPIREPPSPRA